MFWGCKGLTSITIPDGVTSIGESAFFDCSGLTSITIPDGVTEIGELAFSSSGLTSITIPNSVTEIGWGAFSDCCDLTEFKGKYASADGRCIIVNDVFKGFARYGITEYAIPDGVTSIEYAAFRYCFLLTSISIPNSVTYIDDGAFTSCGSLSNIIIPNSVITIGDYAFSFSGLTSITIPDGVTEIGEYAFSGCSSLTSLYCKATTPPTGGMNMFLDSNTELQIYVPTASVDAYKAAANWSDYADKIVGYDF